MGQTIQMNEYIYMSWWAKGG